MISRSLSRRALLSDRFLSVVFCPGNAGSVSSHLEYVRLALRTGYSVLGFDYHGFGRSDGEADLRTVVHDVEAACEFTAS